MVRKYGSWIDRGAMLTKEPTKQERGKGMKKTVLSMLSVAALVAMSAMVAYAGTTPGSGVSLSKHDINTLAGATKDNQERICAFCHTPHHAVDPTASDYMPLWSHDLTQQTYIPYLSATLETETKNVVDPLVGPSRLCMSCHDGIIAADQHYGTTQTATKVLTGDTFNTNANMAVGTNGDMTNDHPIGFDYTKVAGADGGAGTDKHIFPATDTLAFKGNATVLVKDQLLGGNIMTCATCHDVHNKDNTNGGATGNYFVYAPQKDSQLCLTCHDK